MNRLDARLLIATLLLTVLGLLAVYSSGGRQYFVRQLLFLPAAVGALGAAYFIPRRVWHGLAEPFYFVALALLLLVLLVGSGPGSKRWFTIGPLAFQPSEFAKLATVMMLAKNLAAKRHLRFDFRSLALPVLIPLVPALLIILEPDLSTALLPAAILAAMLYWWGVRPIQILALYAPLISFAAGFSLFTWIPFFLFLAVVMLLRTNLARTVVALAVCSFFGLLSPALFSVLKDYQRARVMSFLAPWLDPQGVGWNAIQSRIAVGSGRLFGKGYLNGSQSRLGFLPSRHTDFIFSCVGEEFGFLGGMAVLGLFTLLIRRCLVTARFERDRFAALVCVGCAAIIGYQVITNIAMLLGLAPISGIALPFMSYGGSSLVASFAAVGLVLNVASRRE